MKPPPTHREVLPVRECPECGAYLASANEDDYCAVHGGWIVQTSTIEAREDRAELLEELLAALP